MTDTAFELARLVKDSITTYEGADRGPEFVETVLNRISPKDYAEALRQALGRLVHVYDNEYRRSAMAQATRPVAPTAGDAPPTFTSPVSGKVYASRKVQQQAEVYWPQFLRTRIITEAGSKMLGYATVQDLTFYVGTLHEHAAQTTANARKYEQLRDRLIAKGLTEVRQLDPADYEELEAA